MKIAEHAYKCSCTSAPVYVQLSSSLGTATTTTMMDFGLIVNVALTPDALFNLSHLEFIELLDSVRSLSTNKRKQLNKQLVMAYHQQTSPLLELLMRLVYEASIRMLDKSDFYPSNTKMSWFEKARGDKGHKERVVRLVKTIRADRVLLGQAAQCRWLQFGWAVGNNNL